MALTAVKREEAQKNRLESLILEYAEMQAQESNIRKAKEFLRQEIEMLMPELGDGVKEVSIEVDGIVAKMALPQSTRVVPEKLYNHECDPSHDLFWRLVKVGVEDAKGVLPASVFHEITEVIEGIKPQLSVRRQRGK